MKFIGTITVEDYWTGGEKRVIADELLTALHLDAAEVSEIRVTYAGISVDLLDRRTASKRTVRYPFERGSSS